MNDTPMKRKKKSRSTKKKKKKKKKIDKKKKKKKVEKKTPNVHSFQQQIKFIPINESHTGIFFFVLFSSQP
jgi:hypothetical protein